MPVKESYVLESTHLRVYDSNRLSSCSADSGLRAAICKIIVATYLSFHRMTPADVSHLGFLRSDRIERTSLLLIDLGLLRTFT